MNTFQWPSTRTPLGQMRTDTRVMCSRFFITLYYANM